MLSLRIFNSALGHPIRESGNPIPGGLQNLSNPSAGDNRGLGWRSSGLLPTTILGGYSWTERHLSFPVKTQLYPNVAGFRLSVQRAQPIPVPLAENSPGQCSLPSLHPGFAHGEQDKHLEKWEIISAHSKKNEAITWPADVENVSQPKN